MSRLPAHRHHTSHASLIPSSSEVEVLAPLSSRLRTAEISLLEAEERVMDHSSSIILAFPIIVKRALNLGDELLYCCAFSFLHKKQFLRANDVTKSLLFLPT